MNRFLRLISLCLVFSSTKAQKNEPCTTLMEAKQNPSAVKKMVLQEQQLDYWDLRHLDLTLFKNLEELFLDRNFFRATPYTVGNLPSLKVLSLSHNWMPGIEPHVVQLQSLQKIDLSYNHMKAFNHYSVNLGNLKNLEVLNLSHNKIKEVNDRIGRVAALKHLDLSYNRLVSAPRSIGRLKRL